MINGAVRAAITILGFAIIAVAALLIYIYSGIYDIGADDHHTALVAKLLTSLREHSIAQRTADITVPNLEDPTLILKGAGQYAAMCTGCHLKPGVANSEIRPGLYPEPPNLAKVPVSPGTAFWVIKHGIKMSGMPAWGATHDDQTIWSIVAFVRKLPDMSAAQYRDMVAKAPPDDDMQ